ncbi:MAG: helix-turn-helix domain-containing protein [Bacteroidota bacterium]
MPLSNNSENIHCPDGQVPHHGDCKRRMLPVLDALDILGGKWKLHIIAALLWDARRFGDLQKAMPGITAKMLSKELKELEVNLLVKRTVYDTMPVKVEYELTEAGHTLREVIDALSAWGTLHRERILHPEAAAPTEKGNLAVHKKPAPVLV